MRISLVLIMILALATSAQAAIDLSLSATTVAVDNTMTVNVISSDASYWNGFFVLSEDVANWKDPVAAAIYDYGPGITPVPDYPGVLQLTAGSPGHPPEPGTQFWIQIKGVQAGTIYTDLQDELGGEMANGPLPLVVVVPEPMTVALLGLGGLLLRRRGKK
ncbi:MAG: PEP-CTERM sorting domain-containing protein [Sedimentisphaerales bacterium]